TLAIRSAADGLKDLAGVPLDGDNNGTAAGDFSGSVPVAGSALPVVSLADFAPGATQSVFTPPNTAGLPLSITRTTINGHPTTSVAGEFVYDPGLLTVTGLTTTISGWTASINPNSATLADGRKVASFTVSGAAALSGTPPVVVGSIQASVPSGALYG